jgi:hypothetical protein
MVGRRDGQAVCRGASEQTGIVRRLGIVDPRPAESFCDLESRCRSSESCRESRGFDKLSRKRTCGRSARSVEGESGGRHSGIASPARLNWSRAVNWSLSARRMASNSGSSGFHSSIPLSRFRCPRWGSRASRRAEGQLPSRKLYKWCKVSLPCDTKVLNCTRVCASGRKDEADLDFGGAGLRLLDTPFRPICAFRGIVSRDFSAS